MTKTPLERWLSSAGGDGGVVVLRTGRQSLGILVMLTFTAVMDARVCVWEETMFLLARYAVAAAVCLDRLAMMGAEHQLKLIAGRLSRLTQCAERRSRHDQLTNAAALSE